jgi:hypothetical protein
MEAAYSVFEAPEEDTGEHPPIIAESTRTPRQAAVEADFLGVAVGMGLEAVLVAAEALLDPLGRSGSPRPSPSTSTVPTTAM